MKLLPVLLLNLAFVVIALAVYDQTRRPEAAPGAMIEADDDEISTLERRLRSLEAERRPEGPDLRILERLAALEEASSAPATSAAGSPAETVPAPPPPVEPPPPAASSGEPDADAIRRFRRLQEAVRREDRLKKIAGWVEGRLVKLGLNLTTRQKQKIVEAQVAFEPRKAAIWVEAKTEAQTTLAAGGAVTRATVVAETTAVIQKEFARSIHSIVSPAEAEAIARALNPR